MVSDVPAGPFRRGKQAAGAVTRRVFAAVAGRNDEPDLPAGWVQLGVDGDGLPLYGYIGPGNPRWYFKDLEDLRDRWGR
jgi:hypothetical protein